MYIHQRGGDQPQRVVELRCRCGWRWRVPAATDPDGARCPVCAGVGATGVTTMGAHIDHDA